MQKHKPLNALQAESSDLDSGLARGDKSDTDEHSDLCTLLCAP